MGGVNLEEGGERGRVQGSAPSYRFQRPAGRLGWGPRVMIRATPGHTPDRDHVIITILIARGVVRRRLLPPGRRARPRPESLDFAFSRVMLA
jgi:hypothetical protein